MAGCIAFLNSRKTKMEKIDLAKLTEAKRKQLDPDNVLTQRGPTPVASTISETPTLSVPKVWKTPEQRADDEKSLQRRERAKLWLELTAAIGTRYTTCLMSRWVYHGSDTQQLRQREVVTRVAKYITQIPERIQGGSNIFLFGPPGTGKDFLVSCVMRDAVLDHGIKVVWQNGVEVYSAIRDAIDSEKSEKSLIRQWVAPQVLCLSDPLPPKGTLGDYQAAMLFQLIDARYRAKKPTWITLNVEDRAEAENRMGTQVVSRLVDGALVCRCEWSDYRKPAK